MTTSPEPISAADREKAVRLGTTFPHAVFTWTTVGAFEARVVELERKLGAEVALTVDLSKSYRELEAALALALEQNANYQGFLAVYQDDEAKAKARAEASEARATALLEALRPFAKHADYFNNLDEPLLKPLYLNTFVSPSRDTPGAISIADLRAARAAINAGASNDRS